MNFLLFLDICYLRLDFEQFVTLGPRNGFNEVETFGGLCQDDNLVFTVILNAANLRKEMFDKIEVKQPNILL